MNIYSYSKQSISKDDLNPDFVNREREVLKQQAGASGKPEEIILKMVEGRLRKFYEEVCLLDQTFVIDGENKVSTALRSFSEEIGSDVTITGFIRFALGEGIERKDEDFASEVASVAGP